MNTDEFEGHTEGPWESEDLFDNGAYWGCRTFGTPIHLWRVRPLPMKQLEGSCYFKNEADAKLIAAAPDLLAELKQIHEILGEAFTSEAKHSGAEYLNMIARVTGLIPE